MRSAALFFAVLVLSLSSTLSSAQASLSGVVTDQTGAALRDAA